MPSFGSRTAFNNDDAEPNNAENCTVDKTETNSSDFGMTFAHNSPVEDSCRAASIDTKPQVLSEIDRSQRWSTSDGTETEDAPGKDEFECSHERRHLEAQEMLAFSQILSAFRYYRTNFLRHLQRKAASFDRIPDRQKALVPNFRSHLEALHDCALHNFEVIRLILQDVGEIFLNIDSMDTEVYDGAKNSSASNGSCHDLIEQETDLEPVPSTDHHKLSASSTRSNSSKPNGGVLRIGGLRPVSAFNMDKLHSTLRQVARDWSAEGANERNVCYRRLIDEIMVRFPDQNEWPHMRVLVPGAGLGRLAWEFARLGFQSQGNEFSYFMLIVSNFILNSCRDREQFVIYPWIHHSANNLSNEDQLRPLPFPDVSPAELPAGTDFSMIAGDFLQVYENQPNEWDVVCTVFFIDTAHNVLSYIELIYKLLRPGGLWLNFGPLLYHFADMAREDSIELSWTDLRSVIERIGFVFLKEETNCASSYTQNERSMLKYEYDCIYFVCEKPEQSLEIK